MDSARSPLNDERIPQRDLYGSLQLTPASPSRSADIESPDGAMSELNFVEDPEFGQYKISDEIATGCNALAAMLGVSLFSVPWGYAKSGVLGGTLIIFIVTYFSYDSARLLLSVQKVHYSQTGIILSFPEMAGLTLGQKWNTVVTIATIVSCLGACVGYLIFLGQTVGQMFSLSPSLVLMVAAMPLVFLSWIRTFKELTSFTVFGVLSLLVTISIIITDGLSVWKGSADNIGDVPLIIPSSIMDFVGPATFLFTIHYCLLAMGAEQLSAFDADEYGPHFDRSAHISSQHFERINLALGGRPSSPDNLAESQKESVLIRPIRVAFMVALLIVFVVGVAGSVLYKDAALVRDFNGVTFSGCEDSVCQNVLLNLSPGVPRNIVAVLMIAVIILSYVLILIPAREHIERVILSCPPFSLVTHDEGNYGHSRRNSIIEEPAAPILHLETPLIMWVRNLIRTVLVVTTVGIAVATPFFGSVIGAVGGLTDALQCFVLPPMIYLCSSVALGDDSAFSSKLYSANNSPSPPDSTRIVGGQKQHSSADGGVGQSFEYTTVVVVLHKAVRLFPVVWGVCLMVYTFYNVITGAV